MCVNGAEQLLEPSPKLTQVLDIASSASEALTVTVTVAPSLAGLGETLVMLTVGARSFTVSVFVPEPVPAVFVALTVIVKILWAAVPTL